VTLERLDCIPTRSIKAIDLRKKKRKDGNVEGGKTKEIER